MLCQGEAVGLVPHHSAELLLLSLCCDALAKIADRRSQLSAGYTGRRRSDVVRLGRQHLAAGELRVAQAEDASRKPVRMVRPALRHVGDRSSCGDLAFLLTVPGQPFAVAGN